MLESLAHTILRHRKLVVAIWIVLTLFGGFAAPRAADRLLTTFSIPSSKSYQNNQQIVEKFGNGSQNPMVLVFHDPSGDVTQAAGIQDSLQAALKVNPDARLSSYFNTGDGLGTVRVQGRPHDVRGDVPGRRERIRIRRHHRRHPGGDRRRAPRRASRLPSPAWTRCSRPPARAPAAAPAFWSRSRSVRWAR